MSEQSPGEISRKILSLFESGTDPQEPLTTTQILEQTAAVDRTVYKQLEALAERGQLKHKKVGGSAGIWWLPASSDQPATALETHRRLQQLNAVLRDVGQVVARGQTKEEITAGVCETLVECDQFRHAIAGSFSAAGDEFEPWACAGFGGQSPSDILQSESETPFTGDIATTAVATGEVRVSQSVDSEPVALRQGVSTAIQSYATVPLVTGETVRGVLAVYADQTEVFGSQTRPVLEAISEIIGYALSDVERTEVRERVIEMELQSERLADRFDYDVGDEVHAQLESTVTLSSGKQLQYWEISGIEARVFQKNVVKLPGVLDAQLLSTVDTKSRFEITATDESIAAIFENFDGELQSITATASTAVITGHLPGPSNLGVIVGYLQESYPDIQLTGQKEVLTPTYLNKLVTDRLTCRQLAVLQAAYSAGYFDQPRVKTGEEIANRLDITKQTFHHHLRIAEASVFEQLFDGS